MTKLFGLMQWACGSIAVALTVVSLAAVPVQNAWADEPGLEVELLGTCSQATCSGRCGIINARICSRNTTTQICDCIAAIIF